jgi:hypothetical protein
MTPDIGFNIDFFSANKFVRGEKKTGRKTGQNVTKIYTFYITID